MLWEKLDSTLGDPAKHDSSHPDAAPEKKSKTDKNNSLIGMLDKILEENNDTSEMQENIQVDADVSVFFFSVLNDPNVT